MSRIIGIDLGTTNSCVSILENGMPVIIPNAEGNRTTPSAVAYKGGEILVGESAKRQAVINKETILSFKSNMGGTKKYTLGGKKYYAQEVSTILLKTLKEQAEAYLNEEVQNVVITVPAYFTDAQRLSTRNAAIEAGLIVERVINEPTAAALAYGIDTNAEDQTILVYDFGGGTFDVSVLEIGGGLFQVISTAGDRNLGGDDIDEAVTKFLLKQFKKESGIDVSKDVMIVRRIREVAEKAKKELSVTNQTDITLPFLTVKDGEPVHFNTTLTLKDFNKITKSIIDKTKVLVEQAIEEAGLDVTDIDKVILVGGSTRIPYVVKMVKDITGKEPFKGINPDEAIAIGAAVQGAIISGQYEDIVLVDVTSLTLGVATSGGLFSPIVPKNSSIPTSLSKTFTTAFDNQQIVTVEVYQGERKFAADNRLLGTLQLTNICPGPAGTPKIEVTFSIDQNGIVSVSAQDKATGKKQIAIMQSEYNLTDSERERMIKEASANKADDERRAKEVKLTTRARNAINLTRETLRNLTIDLSDEEKERMENRVKELEDILKTDDYAKIEESTEHLRNSLGILLVKELRNANEELQGLV